MGGLPLFSLSPPLRSRPHIAARGVLKLPKRVWAEPGRKALSGAFLDF